MPILAQTGASQLAHTDDVLSQKRPRPKSGLRAKEVMGAVKFLEVDDPSCLSSTQPSLAWDVRFIHLSIYFIYSPRFPCSKCSVPPPRKVARAFCEAHFAAFAACPPLGFVNGRPPLTNTRATCRLPFLLVNEWYFLILLGSGMVKYEKHQLFRAPSRV